MDTEDWYGLVVRTRSALRFGVVVGVFTDGPHAGRLRVHGTYRFGGGTQAEYQGTLVYAIPPEVVRRMRRGGPPPPGGGGGAPAARPGGGVGPGGGVASGGGPAGGPGKEGQRAPTQHTPHAGGG